jgi:hypothetical protein
MSPEPERPPVIEIAPALTNVAWSREVVSQSIEALFVCLGDDGVHHLRPILAPLLVHSTSWRLEGGRVVLTYLVAVERPEELSENLADEPVARADLARGDAMGPPPEIGVPQVLEHAFRHLSWLVKDDQAVRAAVPDWVAFLDRYEPEPFRPFGAPPG